MFAGGMYATWGRGVALQPCCIVRPAGLGCAAVQMSCGAASPHAFYALFRTGGQQVEVVCHNVPMHRLLIRQRSRPVSRPVRRADQIGAGACRPARRVRLPNMGASARNGLGFTMPTRAWAAERTREPLKLPQSCSCGHHSGKAACAGQGRWGGRVARLRRCVG